MSTYFFVSLFLDFSRNNGILILYEDKELSMTEDILKNDVKGIHHKLSHGDTRKVRC
jgi:hypothetical protein